MNINEVTVLAAWIGLEAVLISFGIFSAFEGASLILLFPVTVSSWFLYLGAHYFFTGDFIDSDSGKGNNIGLVSVIGLLAMVSAFPVGTASLSFQNFHIMVIAQIMFLGGYATAHKQITGEFL